MSRLSAAPAVQAVRAIARPLGFQRSIINGAQAGHGIVQGANCFSTTLNDTSDFALGSQSVTMVTKGDGTTADIHAYGAAAFSLADRTPVVWLKVDDLTHLNSLKFRVGTSSAGNYYEWGIITTNGLQAVLVAGEWVPITLSFGDAATSSPPGRGALTDFRLWAIDDNTTNKVTIRFGGFGYVMEPIDILPEGCVSLTFDAAPTNQMTIAKPLMDVYGFPATNYPLVDQVGAGGSMTIAQLQALRDESGWEIGAHAYLTADHDLTNGFLDLSADAQVAEMEAMRRWGISNGFSTETLALSQGRVDVGLEAVADRYFMGSRTTIGRLETWPPYRRQRLRSYGSISTFSGGTSVATITAAVAAAKANKAWLILTFHSIVAGAPTALTELNSTDFTTILTAIATAAIPVRTVEEMLRLGTKTEQRHPLYVSPAAGTGPEFSGYRAWSIDPANLSNSTALTAGLLYNAVIYLPRRCLVSNLSFNIQIIGATLTAGQNFAALYRGYGAGAPLIGATADQTTLWSGTTGTKAAALSAAVVLDPGYYTVAWWSNGTTKPAMLRGSGSASNIANATQIRWATADAGVTTTAPAVLGAQTAINLPFWVGLS